MRAALRVLCLTPLALVACAHQQAAEAPPAPPVVAEAAPPVAVLGHVTSADFSPMLDQPIALALVSGGLERKGETLHAAYPLAGESVPVIVADPVFFDPEGKRLHG